MTDNAVILFDGVCNLCNASVNFVIDRDPRGYFRFAALQSDVSQKLMARHNLPGTYFDSIVFIENGRAYTKSTAALRVARKMAFPWPIFYSFIIIPGILRDPLYDWIGRNRYRWFGKQESCRIPTPELKQRSLS